MKRKLRTGFTTGTAAAAATKGALTMIVEKKAPSSVPITLLTGDTLDIAIHSCELNSQDEATCTVIKDAGDDPDITHKAEIGASVKLLDADSGFYDKQREQDMVRIMGGKGVGRVTKPGLEVPPGEPAINPGPRKMIIQATNDIVEQHNIRQP
ncbi:MAG: cobalt-precorrin-5B (C(1))-methyltransferase, partial [Desulfobacteraceae bacterium]